jgi:alanine racemase
MAEAGLGADIELTLFSVEGGHAAAARLLDRGVTGIICGSDLMALGATRAVRARGLTIPGDVSVLGYDDSALLPFTDPPLSTLRQPVLAMALAAVRALTDEIGGQPAPNSEYVFQPELVIRGSTGVAPSG